MRLMMEQGRLETTFFHLVLCPLWMIGKEETGIEKRKWEWSWWTVRAGDFAGRIGIGRGNQGKEGQVPGPHSARGRAELADVLIRATWPVRSVPRLVRGWGLHPECHVPLAHSPLWVTTITRMSTQHLLGGLASPHSRRLSLVVRNIIYGFYFSLGLRFSLFIKFLDSAVVHDVSLAFKYLICKAVKLGSLF